MHAPLIHLGNIWDWCRDLYFDWRMGINASGIVELARLQLPLALSQSKEHGRRYQGTRQRVFVRAMRRFQKHLPQGTFLDIGCGKGRAMILAKLYGQKKILGLDFSPQLLRICQSNLQNFHRRHAHLSMSDFELIHGDVCQFYRWDEIDVVYLYNPFDGVILKRVMQAWERSLRPEQKLYVIYVNPLRAYLFDLHPWARLLESLPALNHNNAAKLYLFTPSVSLG